MTKGCLFGQPFFVASKYFLLSFALSESQQFGVRNQHTTPDASYCQLLFYDERVQRSFADSNEPSGFRFAVEQNVPVHSDTSGFWLFNFVAACGRAVLKNSPLLSHQQNSDAALFGKQNFAASARLCRLLCEAGFPK
jgi:hypothetical protein